jgi:2-polyprenyl-6-methoxyphenol hydroxylase-like FAD-dependent oxidoreductase
MPDVRAKVVIVGAGFGGIEAAKSLRSAPVEVTVIDRQNHHCFQPLLYQVATAALSPADVAFLWLPEMVRVRGTGPDPLYQQRPADFLDVPCFRHPRGQLVSGRFRMAVRCAAVPGILEQATGNLGSHWVDCHVRDDGHDHPVHAEWLGSGCRISGDGRQRSLPDEGCRHIPAMNHYDRDAL